jgi:hypothetical protein
LPFKDKTEYNDYKRQYMREYRGRKKLSKQEAKLPVPKIPKVESNLKSGEPGHSSQFLVQMAVMRFPLSIQAEFLIG